ncbi:DUF1798 family protein [Virgibacillus dakarensis]|uniref:DUF1798 domain-containing protein n=1 Tax=Lentibacillus populi TaxID=1827502 RepID=A0A9W5X473_9BACI|nr:MULTISPECIES: DUF1798 family protein [Bacillaceae]MBT2214229.1 DUF1798 family protein [Virgibacillus dakarensis]MTW85946.1 DUF1798 family protein [Virgibacillus dakarensis]GGB33154.1 hypothetical protein GCM10011409_08250 [Lentibacillus populi]
MELKEQTETLKKYLDQLKEQYEHNDPPKDKRDKEFFSYVKETTSPIYKLVEDWEENALTAIKQRKANVHPQQVQSTRENLELLLMHSFYIDVKRKRYMELNHSIHYVLDQLQREITD